MISILDALTVVGVTTQLTFDPNGTEKDLEDFWSQMKAESSALLTEAGKWMIELQKVICCNDDRRADNIKLVMQEYKDCSAKILKESRRIEETYHKMSKLRKWFNVHVLINCFASLTRGLRQMRGNLDYFGDIHKIIIPS